jgi:hypothetical protein
MNVNDFIFTLYFLILPSRISICSSHYAVWTKVAPVLLLIIIRPGFGLLGPTNDTQVLKLADGVSATTPLEGVI